MLFLLCSVVIVRRIVYSCTPFITFSSNHYSGSIVLFTCWSSMCLFFIAYAFMYVTMIDIGFVGMEVSFVFI